MCTVVVLNQVRSDFPVILATNRDEFYARPTSGPERILHAPSTVGGRDLSAQGTWMGVTQDGLFVGVTNQRTFTRPDPSLRSRGELVMRALALGGTDAIRELLRGEDARVYNGFNLLFGTARGLYAAYGRDTSPHIEIELVPPGVHVLPNDRLDSPSFAKVERARALMEPWVDASFDSVVAHMKQTLADRQMAPLVSIEPPPEDSPLSRELLRELSALCVRTPAYGTRSSTVVALTDTAVARYEYADGPPDRTEFVDVMPLFGANDGRGA